MMEKLWIVHMKSFPKNPLISKVFREIGYAAELGSGMRNASKYTEIYSGASPSFIEGDIFVSTIPLAKSIKVSIGPENGSGKSNTGRIMLNKTQISIVKLIKKDGTITQNDLALSLDISVRSIRKSMKLLQDEGFLLREGTRKIGKWVIIKDIE